MPWVTKFNYYASVKMNEYARLESTLTNKCKAISNSLSDVRNCKRTLLGKVDYMGDLSGDYIYKYENKRDDYFNNYLKIDKSFDNFIKDLNQAISQCNSKKVEWSNKIYTSEWEDEPEDKIK